MPAAKTIPVELQSEMKQSFLDYSMSVIVARALPDVRDGLKPVHRRVLYAMYDTHLTSDHPYSKSVATVGEVMKYYHPHGDAAIYDTLVRMAQDFSLRYPLIDGHGNFGSVDGDPPAAMRYTEARMAKLSNQMLENIEKETVDFVPNFDGSKDEPSCLPSRFPNLLVNGSVGIAVGMATNIPPHNLIEVIDAIDYLIDNPEAEMGDLMQYIKGPDFPTGGIIMGRSGIREAYATGRGKITLRGKAEIVEKGNKSQIIISEIPYMVNKSRLVESIAELHKSKRIEGLSGLVDASDKKGMKIIIDVKRDASPEIVLNRLYSYSQLQDTVGVIMLALVNGVPRILTLKEMLQNYLDFQIEIITRRTRYDLRKAEERIHILEALLTALGNIDEVIAILKSSPNVAEGKQRLMERFNFDDAQADAIVAMRLGQLTGLERSKIEAETAELEAKIADYKDILANRDRVTAIVKEELGAIKAKYGDERRTAIENVSGEVDVEALIPVEDCIVTRTMFGYVKRLPVDTYRSQNRGGRGVSGMTRREEDYANELFVASSHDRLAFVTDSGRIFKLKCYEIPETSRNSKGMNAINLLQLQDEEKVAAMMMMPELEEGLHFVFVTRKGIIKRTALTEFANVRRSGIIALSIDEGDELAWASVSSGNDEFILATRKGMAIRFKETDVRAMGRNARGVKAMTLDEDDEIIGLEKIREGATLLTVSEKGFGRRTDPDEYRLIHRGGKGVTNYKQIEKRGLVAGIKMVTDEDDVIMITDSGIILRTSANQISEQSRYGGGVTVMRVDDGCKVVTITSAPKEEAEEPETTDEENTSQENTVDNKERSEANEENEETRE
ncbi:MAG TPA: DNA gyrase subunit A [Oscillospiraceae bacterium]|nr:DNA gyrase subunit A [Oscillospiraceae bacterium]HPF55047.1 DNA gyrase subunit A [Clostridiales bacterium]HPK34864.1 DNA gyrase subunit A [Oscillospiraceae bacterium]HPR76172.1 DNA gyrase subunit A [Oscillospiraceae bacterium]